MRIAWPRRQQLGQLLLPYLLLAPIAIVLGTIIALPIADGVQSSLRQGRLGFVGDWVGLANYERLTTDRDALRAWLFTFVYLAVTVPLSLGAGLMSALALNRRFRFSVLAKLAITAPIVISDAATSLIMLWIFNPTFGVANVFARLLPWVSENPKWYLDQGLAIVLVLVVSTWRTFPYYTLLFLAALQTLPRDVLEAARVDGAGAYRLFRHITLPWLVPTIAVTTILGVISGFKAIGILILFTGGGPGTSTETIGLRTYRTAFSFFDFHYANTLATSGILAAAVVTVVFIHMRRRVGTYAADL